MNIHGTLKINKSKPNYGIIENQQSEIKSNIFVSWISFGTDSIWNCLLKHGIKLKQNNIELIFDAKLTFVRERKYIASYTSNSSLRACDSLFVYIHSSMVNVIALSCVLRFDSHTYACFLFYLSNCALMKNAQTKY